MSSIAPSVFLVVLLATALIRLPPLHPIQMYSAPWAVATTLYALKLLPYRELTWLTAAVICGSALAFSAAALAGERLGSRSWSNTRPNDAKPASPATYATAARYAAWAALLIGAPLFLAFLAQTASRFGLANTLFVAKGIRSALVTQSPSRLLLYERLAFPAVALWSLAAALAISPLARRRCLLGCVCVAASLYFSTGRELLVNALIIAVMIQLTVRERRLAGGRIAVILVVLGSCAVVAFVGIGALGGHTFNRSGIWTFDNFFARHHATSVLALPYEDLSAPIAALDRRVAFSSTWGRTYGCATAARECALLQDVGLKVERSPPAPPFTGPPLPWNAYTYLDDFLLDGGRALAWLLVAIMGVMAGLAWSFARLRNHYGAIAYAFSVPVLIFSYRQNLLDNFLLDALTAMGLLWVSTRFALLRNRQPSTLRSPWRPSCRAGG
ncbi:MAG: O-antigen polymerase [Solirubrobacteraceae bacterium]